MPQFDAFGPEKIVEVYHPKLNMRGFLVIDNTALGPGKGGIRMTPTLNEQEIFRLARTMTWKNSLAELPFGGAKSGIMVNPRLLSPKQKDEITKAFSRALKLLVPKLYVAAPDISMAEHDMEVFAKENGSMKACTGKPKKLGGIPHELGSTGFGVYHSALIACKHAKKKLSSMEIAIEGFGNVGWFAAKFLSERGAKIVAVSDSKGVIYNKKGLDFNRLAKVKKEKRTVTAYQDGKVLKNKEIVYLNSDMLITAAVPDLIVERDVEKIKADIIIEGSNIPTKPYVEELLFKKGVLIVPDFVANAGGVISSYVEYINGTKQKMFKLVEKKIKKNTELVLKNAEKKKVKPRDAAMEIAKKRVLKKCSECKI